MLLTAVITLILLSGSASADRSVKTNLPKNNTINSLQQTDVIKILAVRVEFQIDSLETTSGNGKFNTACDGDTAYVDPGDTASYDIDPIPHDRDYFQRQLRFLKNYYEDISNGSLTIDISDSTYPRDSDSAYTLDYPMWHYNYNNDDPLVFNSNYTVLDSNLALLFRDAWLKASEDEDIDFSQFDPEYDCFIIFHAGVGQDFAFDYDPTPFDIPSAYMESEDITEPLGMNPGGVLVDTANGYYIKQGMILPEAETQVGYNLGMHGHLAILMGHHIGLPNLYNSETGESVIGWFGLMDQGSGKLDGLVPAPPCAWSKVFMGWTQPVLIDSFPNNITAPVGTIFKIPINSSEYFLIENIDSYVYWGEDDGVMVGVSYDSMRYAYYDSTGEYADAYFMLTDTSFVRKYQTVDFDNGVLVDMENWGIGRPGSGILIWHIDEEVIQNNISSNRINTDKDRLGVYIEEADGAVDIGKDYWLFDAGYGSELGSPYDAFFDKNEAWEKANADRVDVIFDDETHPDAKSNSGAYSHLVLKDFSVISDTMSFVVTNDLLMPGFPKDLDLPVFLFSADVDGDDCDELFAAEFYTLHGWEQDGSVIPVQSGAGYQPYFYEFNTKIVSKPAVYDFNDDGCDEIILQIMPFAYNSRLYKLSYSPIEHTVSIDSVLIGEQGNPVYSDFILTDGELIYIGLLNNIYAYQADDLSAGSVWDCEIEEPAKHAFLTPPGILTDDGALIVVDQSAVFHAIDKTGQLLWSYHPYAYFGITGWPNEMPYPPALGDIDHDGHMEMVFVCGYSSQNILIIVDVEGMNLVSSYTEYCDAILPSDATGPPSLADIDDDDYMEIIIPTIEDGILVYEHNGVINDYAPYPLDGTPADAHSVVCGKTNNAVNLFYTGIQPEYDNTFIFACDEYGDKLTGYPISVEFAEMDLIQSPLLYHLGGVSTALAFAAGNRVYSWKTDVKTILWGSIFGDKRNSCAIDTIYTESPPDIPGGLMPDDLVYAWPNPNKPGENSVNIRYYLNDYAEMRFRIYDMAGDKVDELKKLNNTAPAYNEIVWDLTSISSGIYFARVEAKGSGEKAVKIIKIAVIK